MTREEILIAAKKCVCGEREEDYGTPENNFALIAKFWNAYLEAKPEKSISAADVGAMMALLKIARMATGSKADNYVDLAGYAACAGEIATKGVSAE